MQHKFATTAVAFSALIVSSVSMGNGADYNDGPVVNVSAIRTVDGHFDDYMHWLATGFKKQEEAARKAGLIVEYHVYTAEPHGPNDPDIYLVVEYKNWAALDGIGAKFDALTTQTEGSVQKADDAEVSRAKIRTVLGSQTIQEALLK